MKFLSALLLFVTLGAGCFNESNSQPTPLATLDGVNYFDWALYYDAKISKMQSPVTLIGKEKTFGCWGVTLKDANGEILTIGNLVSTANNIGNSRNIGEVIK